MDINRPFPQPFPNLFEGEPSPGEISEDVAPGGNGGMLHEIAAQSEHAAEQRRHELRFPFIGVVRMFEKADIALNDLWERQNAPAPKFRSGGTGDTCNGGLVPFPLNSDPVQFVRRERAIAGLAIASAAQESAGGGFGSILGIFNRAGDSLRESGLVGPSKGCHRNGLPSAVNRD